MRRKWLASIAMIVVMSADGTAGKIVIHDLCPPKKVRIHIENLQGKTLIDHTLVEPKNDTPLVIRLDPSREYRFGIETFPHGVRCYFKGARGDKLPPDPDLICDCLQQVDKNGTINIRPGKWHLTGKLMITSGPTLPLAPLNVDETLCIKDPMKVFSAKEVSQVDDPDCKIVSLHQGYTEATYRRLGPNCDMRGTLHYGGDRFDADIFYPGIPNQTPDSHAYLRGQRIGDCP